MATKETYRVRKSWDDVKSQVGAYTILDNAKKACNKAGEEYKVYNSKGECVFPVEVATTPVESAIDTSAANPAQMWDFFKSKGLNDYGVAGLMGNLYAESGLRSCNLQNSFENSLGMNDVEYTKAVDNGSYTNFVKDSAGYGLAQWTYWSLKQDLLNFCKQKNKSIGDLDTQMEFLAYQLEKSYKSVWAILKKAKNVREASDAVLLQFERPADQSTAVQEKRAAYGQTYFDNYGKKEIIIIDKNNKTENETYPKVEWKQKTQSTIPTMTVSGIAFGIIDETNDDSNFNAIINKEAIQIRPWNQKMPNSERGWITVGIYLNTDNEELYNEICKLSAYLCDLFNISPKGKVNNIFTICEYDEKLIAWLEKIGKSLTSLRDDVAKLMGTSASMITPVIPEAPKVEKELFRVRKSWEDTASQAGAFTDFENAKKACDKAGNDYEVYNGEGVAIYPREMAIETPAVDFPVGSEVMLRPGAKYFNGKNIPAWVFETKLYVREVRETGSVVISTQKKGAITGVVKMDDLIEYSEERKVQEVITFIPYLIKVAVDGLNVRSGPGTGYRISTQITKNQVYTIVDEKNGWGKLKSGAGWIAL